MSPDLLSPKWRKISDPRNRFSGHCAIASEALYDMVGFAAAGWTPFVCSYYYMDGERVYDVHQDKEMKRTHWWIARDGKILDATKRQYNGFPYEHGKAAGFMSPHPPSKRARILIGRVEQLLGKKKICDFRRSQIFNFDVSVSQKRRLAELEINQCDPSCPCEV